MGHCYLACEQRGLLCKSTADSWSLTDELHVRARGSIVHEGCSLTSMAADRGSDPGRLLLQLCGIPAGKKNKTKLRGAAIKLTLFSL